MSKEVGELRVAPFGIAVVAEPDGSVDYKCVPARTVIVDPRPEHQARLDALYPLFAECPHCLFNLRRYKMRMELPGNTYLVECPSCHGELTGF